MYFNSFVICLALNKIYQLGKLEFFLGGGTFLMEVLNTVFSFMFLFCYIMKFMRK